MPRGKGKRVLPNRAARRQENQVQLPVNRRRRARRADFIGQNEANPQLPIMPPQQPLLPPQRPILPPQQPILPPQQQLMPPQQPLMPQYLPQQPILPPQQIGASIITQQPTEQQVQGQGGVQLGQSAARNTVENGENLVIPTSNDDDVFLPQKNINQIWNLEYVDLAQLLYKNFDSNNDQPKKKCKVLMKMGTF
ncbi:uncharacterized protein LOC134705727 [Mytilus trossulus]|uniref:uncharacterized protein LOC134705727 n=1 Tax=Mytilus trossulus TaxID=6551 RepID=UPI0030060AEB